MPEEVYRSQGYLACEQRAFILHAVGIQSDIVDLGEAFALMVAGEQSQLARQHIDGFEAERVVTQTPKPQLKLHRHAWVASALYAIAIIAVGFLAGRSLSGFDWYTTGALENAVQRSGDWWRLVTALTLHVDQAHLLGNLGFGVFFCYLAARLLGPGVAFVSTVVAATFGNLLDSLWMPDAQRSMGASTMVFAVLGLGAAYSWRQQLKTSLPWLHSWAHRWGPIVAGIMLLALIGAGGANTDVLAHLTGFFCGALLGVFYARLTPTVFDQRALQAVGATVGIAIVAGAWVWAHFA
ncbi:MAG TPA: rhomboid family intramembrane serine protease [Steroidobacteraceae bacterium]|nr:rhomboid family intramembrane serine protease [Steroidobacteraceae bacterium]